MPDLSAVLLAVVAGLLIGAVVGGVATVLLLFGWIADDEEVARLS